MNGFLLLAVYALIMIVATVIFTRQSTDTDDFYVGDRNMGMLTSAMSIAATWIWAPALFTSAQQAYTNGIPGLFWFLIPNVLCLLFFVPFAKMIRERMPMGITLSGFMGHEYKSAGVKRIYGMQLGLLNVLSTAVQLLAGGKILSTATGMDFTLTTILLAVIAFSYSYISGIKASVMTDAIQMIFLLVACAIFVPWALRMPDGMSNLMHGLSGYDGLHGKLFDAKGIEVLLSFGLPTAIGLVSGPFGDQCFWQRAFSIDQKKIGKAFALGAVLFAIVPASMGVLGYIAAGSGYEAVDKGIVNLELISNLFPRWVILPFLFMLISGLLSTVDSNLCSFSSFVNDFSWKGMDNKGKVSASRIMMVGLLVVGCAIANIPGLTVTHMFLIYGTLRATTLLPTVLTLCRVRLTSSGVIAGISTSMVIGLPLFGYATLNNIAYLKTAASLFTVVSAGVVAVLLSNLGGKKWKKY